MFCLFCHFIFFFHQMLPILNPVHETVFIKTFFFLLWTFMNKMIVLSRKLGDKREILLFLSLLLGRRRASRCVCRMLPYLRSSSKASISSVSSPCLISIALSFPSRSSAPTSTLSSRLIRRIIFPFPELRDVEPNVFA